MRWVASVTTPGHAYFFLLAVGAVASDACAAAPATDPTVNSTQEAVHFGKWGIDLSSRDLSDKPGDDFQRYASGRWMDSNDSGR